MGIPRIPKDAKKLITDHRDLLENLEQVCSRGKEMKAVIRENTRAMLDERLLTALREIPVEEVNREKRGIRIKTLKEHGYRTMADLYAASSGRLEAINGISESGAREIKQIADSLADQLRPQMKIRINSDQRSAKASQLIRAISHYRSSRKALEESGKLYDENQAMIRDAVSGLEGNLNPIKWFFTSGERKQRAHGCYDFLRNQMDGAYGITVQLLLDQLNPEHTTPVDSAWEDFAQNSIGFFQTLEELYPGALGTDDTQYGLPGELAQQIRQEPICLEGLHCQLRRYQEWGVRYILHQKRVLLGDEMGLGKTVQAIAAMVSLRNTGATHFMVICPASVLENWCREICKHSNLRAIKIHGADRFDALESWMLDGGVAVTTYETTAAFQLNPEFGFTMAIVDEAHYVKNPEARRTVHVKELCGHAQRLLFMTGTALENRVEEMISLISVLQPEIAFSVRNMMSLSSAPRFRELIAPVYYRRKREDVLTELPDLIEKEQWCVLQEEEERVYEQAVLKQRYAEARRVSWSVDDPKKSSKANRMLELVEDAAAENRKVIVFSFFLDTIRKVQMVLGDRCLPPINGSIPPQQRQQIVDEFDRAPAGTVLAAQIQAGGTGLNIQSASVVILCEPQFKPSLENQAISRAYRMGQTRNVLVYRLLCQGTVDERITGILERKQKEFDAFADQSVAAEESLELDQTTFGTIIQEEIDRIHRKHAEKPEIAEPHRPDAVSTGKDGCTQNGGR